MCSGADSLCHGVAAFPAQAEMRAQWEGPDFLVFEGIEPHASFMEEKPDAQKARKEWHSALPPSSRIRSASHWLSARQRHKCAAPESLQAHRS